MTGLTKSHQSKITFVSWTADQARSGMHASLLRVRRCTYYESEYARNAGKKMILLRMIGWNAKFEHLQARVLFGMNELVLSWKEEEPMPPSLPDDIVASLGGGGTAGIGPALELETEPEPEPEPEPELV